MQAIDLIDEAGSRVRIAAYNARKGSATKEDPKVDEYLQVRHAAAGGGYKLCCSRPVSRLSPGVRAAASQGDSRWMRTCRRDQLLQRWTNNPGLQRQSVSGSGP